MAPAANTDEVVRGGVYFYGSLTMCPNSGQGPWAPYNVEQLSPRLQTVCSHGVISIVRAVGVHAGPTGRSDVQWAKSGTRPDNAACVGCIITQAFAEAVFTGLQSASSSEYPALAAEFETVLSSPQNYLDPNSLLFLHRYLAAGNVGAYAPYLPLRCAASKYHGVKLREFPGDVTELILSDTIKSFLRDGSWDDARCSRLRSCLACWLKAGVPPSCEKLYVDTLTNREYSQETVEEASQAAFQRLTLVCSPPLQEYHLKLHCLVVAAVGEQNLSSLPDRLLPGTVDFHRAYFSPSFPQPSQAAVSSHQGSFSRGV